MGSKKVGSVEFAVSLSLLVKVDSSSSDIFLLRVWLGV